jgi:hypothetical protein
VIDNNRNTILLAFILVMLAGFALMQSSAMIVFLLLGLLFLVRQFDNKQMEASNNYDTSYEEDYNYGIDDSEVFEDRSVRQVQSEPVYRHALEAVSRAGLNPDAVQVLAVDIGVMAFSTDQEPAVFRTWSLPDDVDYIQPFVQLRLPSKATGRVKFEILDAYGKQMFVHEDHHNLQRGRNFITPAARLPIHDENLLTGKWQLKVSADGVLLAQHQFQFAEASNPNIHQHLGEDGEINTELRAVLAENRLPKMSLDDLLAYQQEEDDAQQRGAR